MTHAFQKQTVVIIDYGSGNLRSAAKSFEAAIADEALNYDVVISSDVNDIAAASHLVLPGQGAFGDCIQNLRSHDGMIEALEERVLKQGVPFFGICVGMQLLADQGFEHGTHQGLGWIGGDVTALSPADKALKIPHMGWNTVQYSENGAVHSLLCSIESSRYYYFVHSFQFKIKDKRYLLGTADYGGDVAAMIGRDNIFGTQFHPEKSQKSGLDLISGFLNWKP